MDSHGYPPTVREIGEQVGLASPSTVHAHLANLERAGLIKRDPTKPRALELTGRAAREPRARLKSTHCRSVGQIAAGGPLLAEQNVDAYISVPEPLSKGGDEFLLRVRGDSMKDAGILEGDLIVVRRQQDAATGKSWSPSPAATNRPTRRRSSASSARRRSHPARERRYEPIYAAHVQILGKVMGVPDAETDRRVAVPKA